MSFENINACFVVDDDLIKGYVLVWGGPHRYGVHLWSDFHLLLMHVPTNEATVIEVYGGACLSDVTNYLTSKGVKNVYITNHIDMAVTASNFKEYPHEGVIRLHSNRGNHVQQFMRLKNVQGRPISSARAVELLSQWRYYGLFTGNELVSIACTYLKMPEVWVIGDVFTHPNHRGRGYR
ncbi:MAG: hypothetical protein J7J11_01080 [Desulfurococcales archaeon]|nr:hypothetical protein [Desulfurococcales archaeon]